MGKRIRILAMGGTIAGSAADSAATTGYQAGAVGVAELLAAVSVLACFLWWNKMEDQKLREASAGDGG